MSDSSGDQGTAGGASAEVASRAQIRREADERFVAAVRVGDADTFGRLFDAWIDPVHDRLARMGIPEERAAEIEVAAFQVAWRDINRGGGASTFGADVLRVATRDAQADRRPSADVTGAHTRIARAANLGAAAADPGVAALLFEAAEALGQVAREVLDLGVRHGLTTTEVAEVLNRSPEDVAALSARLPAAFDAVVRSRILWGEGPPALCGGDTDEVVALRDDLAAAGVRSFGADAVRVTNRRLRDDDRLRARSMVPLGSMAIFGAVPLAGATPEHKRAVAEALAEAGVPLGRSEFASKVRRPSAAAASAAATVIARERSTEPPTAVTPAAGPAAEPTGDDGRSEKDASTPVAPFAAGAAAGVAGAAGVAAAEGAAAEGAGTEAADPTTAVPGRRAPKTLVVEEGALDLPGGDGRDRKPALLVGVGVLLALLLAGGAAVALGGGGGSDDQDVASGDVEPSTTITRPESTTTSTVRRTTTTSTTEPETTTTETTVAPDPIDPVDGGGGGGGGGGGAPAPAPAPAPPGPAPLPTVVVPTTTPRDSYNVTFGVSRGADTSVPEQYELASAPHATWNAVGNVANVVVLDPWGRVIGQGPSGSVPVCPVPGGAFVGGRCLASPSAAGYVYSIKYTFNGLELGAPRTLKIDSITKG